MKTMRANSLKMSLYLYLKSKGVVKIDQLRELAERLGFIESNCERRLRSLRQAGIVSVIKGERGAISHYRFIKQIK